MDDKFAKVGEETYINANEIYQIGYMDGVDNCSRAIENIVERCKDANADTVLSLISQGLKKYVEITKREVEERYGKREKS